MDYRPLELNSCLLRLRMRSLIPEIEPDSIRTFSSLIAFQSSLLQTHVVSEETTLRVELNGFSFHCHFYTHAGKVARKKILIRGDSKECRVVQC